MDVAGAQELRRRIEEREASLSAGVPVDSAAPEPMRLASFDAFDYLESDESDVVTRPALRQWMAHHERTYGSRRAPQAEPLAPPRPGPPGRHLFAERRATSRQTLPTGPAPAGATAAAAVPTTWVIQPSPHPLRLVGTVGLSVVLSVAAAAATSLAIVDRHRAPTPATTAAAAVTTPAVSAPATPLPATTTAARAPVSTLGPSGPVPGPIPVSAVGSYNPFGTGPENNAFASRATDGADFTYWSTETYVSNGFEKPGTGLVVGAAAVSRPTRLDLTTDTPGYVAQIRIGDSPHGPFSADSSWRTVGAHTTFALRGTPGRYLVVWLRLPTHEGAAHVNEVGVTGTPAPAGQ